MGLIPSRISTTFTSRIIPDRKSHAYSRFAESRDGVTLSRSEKSDRPRSCRRLCDSRSLRWMIWQLRTYTMKPGQLDDFVDFWSNCVVPLRKELGFELAGGWRDDEHDVFVWLVGHAAPDGWEAAEKGYYDSPRRSELPRDPRDFVAEVHTRLLRAV
jgi:hypothetical protein